MVLLIGGQLIEPWGAGVRAGPVAAVAAVYTPAFCAFVICAIVHLRVLCGCTHTQEGARKYTVSISIEAVAARVHVNVADSRDYVTALLASSRSRIDRPVPLPAVHSACNMHPATV